MKKLLFAAVAILIVLTLIPLSASATEAETTTETDTIAQVTQLTDRIIPSGKTPQGGSNYGKYFLQTIGGASYCTVTEFTVPATATCFRFCIASVNEGVTDQTFPLETYFEDGVITLQLCQAS